MRLKVVLEPSDEGGFTVYVPSLPGCSRAGRCRAVSNASAVSVATHEIASRFTTQRQPCVAAVSRASAARGRPKASYCCMASRISVHPRSRS